MRTGPGIGKEQSWYGKIKENTMQFTIFKNKEWSYLEDRFTWVADMKGVRQDPIHHAEGDVAVHTKMVLEALQKLPGFLSLDVEERECMWASALLHDVEKRSTTIVEDDGRITSRGHARRGEFTARQILYKEIPVAFKCREMIAALVRYHGLPLWIFEKVNPVKAVIEASLRVNLSWVALLAKADVLGRISRDQEELLERIAFFEAFSEEQQCDKGPRKFSSNLAMYTYFHKEESHPDYAPFDDLKGEVVMMSGLPGMGKDTFIEKHYAGWPVISLDDIRRKHKLKPHDASATGWVVQEAKEQAKILLRKGAPFIWNATNITTQMRTQWIDLFTSYRNRVKLIYIEVPYQDWLKQNAERDYPVPETVLMRLLQKLEVPARYEAHEVHYIV
jgi:predicted kinase